MLTWVSIPGIWTLRLLSFFVKNSSHSLIVWLLETPTLFRSKRFSVLSFVTTCRKSSKCAHVEQRIVWKDMADTPRCSNIDGISTTKLETRPSQTPWDWQWERGPWMLRIKHDKPGETWYTKIWLLRGFSKTCRFFFFWGGGEVGSQHPSAQMMLSLPKTKDPKEMTPCEVGQVNGNCRVVSA